MSVSAARGLLLSIDSQVIFSEKKQNPRHFVEAGLALSERNM
jgi:hypothetical protein